MTKKERQQWKGIFQWIGSSRSKSQVIIAISITLTFVTCDKWLFWDFECLTHVSCSLFWPSLSTYLLIFDSLIFDSFYLIKLKCVFYFVSIRSKFGLFRKRENYKLQEVKPKNSRIIFGEKESAVFDGCDFMETLIIVSKIVI